MIKRLTKTFVVLIFTALLCHCAEHLTAHCSDFVLYNHKAGGHTRAILKNSLI